jgi:hypothetical protein
MQNETSLQLGRERSLHTGEVIGSIPIAPTTHGPLDAGFFISSPACNRQVETEQNEKMTTRLVENTWTLFAARSEYLFSHKLDIEGLPTNVRFRG